MEKVTRTEQEWRELLTDEQYRILRQAGTERPFSGQYVDTEEDGVYRCGACGNELFSSETKYHSGSGWPSFWDVVNQNMVELHEDRSLGMRRIEVRCGRCGSHLGHVFEDGPRDKTGLRYCINSAALDFEAQEDESA